MINNHPGVQMFVKWVERQVSRYGMKVKAVKNLKAIGGWKQQLEKRKHEAAILVQRKYRERLKLRKLELESKLEAEEKRKKLKQQKRLNKELRARQEQQANKHKSRMVQKAHTIQEEKERLEKKRNLIVKKHREAEAERRLEKHHQALKGRCFKNWIVYRRVSIHRKKVNIKLVRRNYRRWKQLLRMKKMVLAKHNQAATLIQKMIRGYLGRKEFRRTKLEKTEKEEKIKINIRRIMQKAAIKCLHAWYNYVKKCKRAQIFFKKTMTSLMTKCFEDWSRYTRRYMLEKTNAATKIQSMFRIRMCKREFHLIKIKWTNAIKIQNCWRVYACKTLALRAKRQKEEHDAKVAISLRRLKWKKSYLIFQSFAAYTKMMKKVRNLFGAKMEELKGRSFQKWKAWLVYWLKHKIECASLIQKIFRGNKMYRAFRNVLRRNRMARKIQARARGMQARIRTQNMYWERHYSTKIQKTWRGRQGRNFFVKKISDFVLKHADAEHVLTVQHALVHQKIDPNKIVDPETGDTLIHRAATNGSKRIIKLCLRNGMDINVRNKAKRTCLHEVVRASYLGQDVLADYIMSKGANLNLKDKKGRTPLIESAIRGLLGMVTFLSKYANLEEQDNDGNTALHHAAIEDHNIIVETLLEAGADPYCKDSNGANPIHDLAANGMVRMLQSYLPYVVTEEFGLNDLLDDAQRTPMHYAIAEGEYEAAQLLFDWGASVSVKDELNRIPLYYACKNGDVDMVKFLLEKDSLVSEKCKKTKQTPLHVACSGVLAKKQKSNRDDKEKSSMAFMEIAKILLRHGCDINVQDGNGEMPIHKACGANNVKLVKLLVSYDCEMNVKSYGGQTPLGIARMNNANQVIKFIHKNFIERDRETQWEIEEKRKAEALSALLGQVKFTKEYGNTKKNDNTLGVKMVQDIEKEKTKDLPQFSFDEWIELLSTRSVLEVELGIMSDCPWKQFRIVEQTENNNNTINSEELTGIKFWYNVNGPVFQWTTPVEVFDLPEATDNWIQEWDEERNCIRFYNERTGKIVYSDESGTNPPPAEGGKFLEKKVKKRILVGGLSTQIDDDNDNVDSDEEDLGNLNMSDYQKFWEEENKELRRKMLQEAAALVIQSAYRRYICAVRAWRQRVMRDMAIRIQSKYRAMKARQRAERLRLETNACLKIQKQYRAYSMRQWFLGEKERLKYEKLELKVTMIIQRVWRGYLGRREYRNLFAQLVDPAPGTSQSQWQRVIDNSTYKRTFRIWEEYLVRWPDVFCYRNSLTKSCTWEKPSELQMQDVNEFQDLWQLVQKGYTKSEERVTIRLQNIYRAKKIRKQFKMMVKGVKIMRESEDKYLDHPFKIETCDTDKEGIVNLCNYVLKLHVIDHNMDKARTLYDRALNYMMHRGPDNAFVLLSYALFLCATCEEEFDVIMDLVYRAEAADPERKSFRLAEAGYFRQATLDQPKDARAFLNYALCLQFYGTSLTRKVHIAPDYDLAEEYYLKALELDPRDNKIVENFNFMLTHLKGETYDAFTAFMNHQERLGIETAAKQKRMQDETEYGPYAKTMQRFIRGFLGRLKVWRIVNSTWEICYDENSGGTPFYYNLNDGNSQWDPPFGMFIVEPSTENNKNKEQAEDATPWEIHQDENGQPFFYNFETEESAWELPKGFATLDTVGGDWEVVETEDGHVYYYNSRTGESTWDNRVVPEQIDFAPLNLLEGEMEKWEILEDEEGTVYYHNLETGETQWEIPQELLKLGTFVHGQFEKGEFWYPGRITKIINEEDSQLYYNIKYDDGDEEEYVESEHILIRTPPKFLPGSPCFVFMDEQIGSLSGMIESSEEDERDLYTILYDDGNLELHVQARRITICSEQQDDNWDQVIGESGLCYYVNKTLGIAQWDPPKNSSKTYTDPVDFRELFRAMDLDNDGYLNRREVFDALQESDTARAFVESVPALHMLLDDFYLKKTYLALDKTDKGYVSSDEFKSVCTRICRGIQVERDLTTMFESLCGDDSILEKHELEQALYDENILKFVRNCPGISSLLNPSIFGYLIKELESSTLTKNQFIIVAKKVLAHVKDLAKANELYKNKDSLSEMLSSKEIVKKCKRAKTKEAFLKLCILDFENERRKEHVIQLFRLIDEDNSGTIEREELQLALERQVWDQTTGEEIDNEIVQFLKMDPHLNKLLEPNFFKKWKKKELNLDDFLVLNL